MTKPTPAPKSSPPAAAGQTDDETLKNLIIFDETCLFCSGFARFMAKHDHSVGFHFVAAQSPLGRKLYWDHDLDPDLMDTNIIIHQGDAFTKMAGLAQAMRSLGWPWRILALVGLLPNGFADWLYDRIAQNRYRLGRRECPLPSEELKNRLLT